jgi:hypothetical protein
MTPRTPPWTAAAPRMVDERARFARSGSLNCSWSRSARSVGGYRLCPYR